MSCICVYKLSIFCPRWGYVTPLTSLWDAPIPKQFQSKALLIRSPRYRAAHDASLSTRLPVLHVEPHRWDHMSHTCYLLVTQPHRLSSWLSPTVYDVTSFSHPTGLYNWVDYQPSIKWTGKREQRIATRLASLLECVQSLFDTCFDSDFRPEMSGHATHWELREDSDRNSVKLQGSKNWTRIMLDGTFPPYGPA